MLLGIYGLFFELWNPGYVLPGVIGGICLLLALYAFQVLPISYAGLGLILLGIAFMVAEAFLPSFGALGIGGVVAFVVGSIILMDTDVEGYTIAWPLIAPVAALSAAFFAVVAMALKARKRRCGERTGRNDWRDRRGAGKFQRRGAHTGAQRGMAGALRHGAQARTESEGRGNGRFGADSGAV
jgi:membrane-bound ClpP family serine protease